MSLCHYVVMPLCRYAIMSLCHYVVWDRIQCTALLLQFTSHLMLNESWTAVVEWNTITQQLNINIQTNVKPCSWILTTVMLMASSYCRMTTLTNVKPCSWILTTVMLMASSYCRMTTLTKAELNSRRINGSLNCQLKRNSFMQFTFENYYLHRSVCIVHPIAMDENGVDGDLEMCATKYLMADKY